LHAAYSRGTAGKSVAVEREQRGGVDLGALGGGGGQRHRRREKRVQVHLRLDQYHDTNPIVSDMIDKTLI